MSTELELFDAMAESGLTLEQAVRLTDACVLQSKRAVDPKLVAGLGSILSGGVGAVRGAIGAGSDLFRASLPLAVAGASAFPLAGYAVGDLAAKTLDADKQDLQEIQEQELISELETNAERLRRIRQLQDQGD